MARSRDLGRLALIVLILAYFTKVGVLAQLKNPLGTFDEGT